MGGIGSAEAPSSMASTMPAGDLAKYLPAIGEGDQIVVHTGFSLSYSEPHEQGVAYLVTAEHLDTTGVISFQRLQWLGQKKQCQSRFSCLI